MKLLQFCGVELHAHLIDLFQPDTVLTGYGAADLRA